MRYIASITGRNIIAYYTDFSNTKKKGTDMDYEDMRFFIHAVRKMDRQKGLDLILHTGAGNLMFTENLVKYLHTEFGRKVRVIIPEYVMREGTMLACAGEEILMNKVTGGVANVPAVINGELVETQLKELEKAREDIQDLQQIVNEETLGMQDLEKGIEEAKVRKEMSKVRTLRNRYKNLEQSAKYHEKRLKEVESKITAYRLGAYHCLMDTRKLNQRLIKEWLLEYQLADPRKRDTQMKAGKIASTLTRRLTLIRFEECEDLGLHVTPLGYDMALLEAVDELTSMYKEQFEKKGARKIIASSETKTEIIN